MREFAASIDEVLGSRDARAKRIALVLVLAVLAGCTREPVTKLSFNEAIQPILSANCYGCHGPDSSSRKAGLRLDRPEFAFAPHEKFAPAIVPGKPDRSPLIHRIEAADPKERMPPPEAHKTLKPEQIALLRHWVKQGAQYEPHWAFIAPKRPAVPTSMTERNKEWARNEIDRFILARLEKEKLAPSPQADKRTLIRRVTYDLTGLPPTPKEVESFLTDSAADAYEKAVDRLLASPRYGEHRAHYWLDYVRYADTHGLFTDNYRAMWPYRDYVIKAFNENKSFEQFVREQLAGDLVPEQTLDSLIATGFIRSNPTTFEGGTIPEEVHVNLTRDRLETFGVTFLGLTTGCAVCHDHKFDPTTQKDTYQLAAFLNNTAEAPTDFGTPDPPPVIRLSDDKDRATYEDLIKKKGDLLTRLAVRRRALSDIKGALPAAHGPQAVSTDQLELRLRFDENQGDRLHNSAPHAASTPFRTENAPIIWGETEWLWPSARFETNTRLSLGTVGDVEADESFSVGGWIAVRAVRFGVPSGAVIARRSDPKAAGGRGWDLSFQQYSNPFYLDNGEPSGRFFINLVSDPTPSASAPAKGELQEVYSGTRPALFKPMRRAIQVRTRDEVPTGQWVHVFVTYDGSRKGEGVRIYLNGRPVATEVMNDSLRSQDSIRTGATTQLGRHENDQDVLRETSYQDLRFYRRGLSREDVARLPYEDVAAEILARERNPVKWTPNESFVVLDRYFFQQDEESRKLQAEIDTVQTQIDRLAPPRRRFPRGVSAITVGPEQSAAKLLQRLISLRPSSLIAQEKTTPAFAHVLKRGNYAARGERVEPGTPHFLPPLPPGVTRNRLALANWLFTPENPLFARVAVNRMWQEVFGTGLVESAGDFGLMGERPSHPQLLDWLAVEFRESGWDVKRMYRTLVLSATYRQSARVMPELLQIDPANRLLAHGPRFRMDAEVIRDSVLAVSGLLVEKIGGPPVFPYQLPGLWREVAYPGSNTGDYPVSRGEDLYRRSIYTFWKRTAPPPSLETFDATTRETACPRRAQSNTPLQALVTLNDPQFVEAARLLAQRVLRVAPDTRGRLDALAQITLSRRLSEKERSILDRSRETFARHFESEPQAVRALLAAGETRSDPALNAQELAIWTLVVNVFLNLDEFLVK